MKNLLIKSHLAPTSLGDFQILVSIGVVEAHLGDTVDVRVGSEIVRELEVADRVVCEIVNTPKEYLEAFEFVSFSELRSAISTGVGTSLPAETTITILLVKEADDAELVVTEEEETEEGGVVDLVFSLEDDEDDEEEYPEENLN